MLPAPLRTYGALEALPYLFETAYGTRDNPSLYAGFYNMLRPGLFVITLAVQDIRPPAPPLALRKVFDFPTPTPLTNLNFAAGRLSLPAAKKEKMR